MALNTDTQLAYIHTTKDRMVLRSDYKSERFICLAMGATGRMNMRWLAKNIITGRLAGTSTCEDWLEEHGFETVGFLTTDPQGKQWMREYRLRWLDSLIAEFS